MSMSLRVVVPPHPLIGHWLTLLRDGATPSPLFATAMAELGRWLTYESLRDWLPHRRVTVETPLGRSEGQVVDPEIPLLVIPVLREGLGLWQGGQSVLPSAQLAHVGLEPCGPEHKPHWFLDDLPATIDTRSGVLVFLPCLASGSILLALLDRLQGLGVEGQRLRVITPLAANPGLQVVGERHGQLTIYCAGIDPEVDDHNRIVPGIGEVSERLYGIASATA
jgi:uracil phosphoribosyltransferase